MSIHLGDALSDLSDPLCQEVSGWAGPEDKRGEERRGDEFCQPQHPDCGGALYL